MDFSVMRTYTRRLLAEQVAVDSFWSDTDIDSFNNQGYVHFVSLSEILQCTSKTDSKAATATGMPENGEYAMPIDALRIMRIYVKDPSTSKWGDPLTSMSLEEIDKDQPGWVDSIVTTGKPTHWIPRGQLYHLVPAHNIVGSQNILLWCVQSPTLLSGTQTPAVPEAYHEAICYGGALRALESDRGADAAEKEALYKKFSGHFYEGVTLAKSQQNMRRPIYQVRDIRDFYPTTSGWRV